MANRIPNPVKRLSLADPEIAQTLADAWQRRNEPLSTRAVAELADQVIWGLSQSERFGRAIATGYHVLLGCADSEALQLYREQVRSAGAKGATLGVLIAKHLAEILQAGDARLVQRFLATVAVMLGKGTYTLKKPLEALAALVAEEDLLSAFASLKMFGVTFAQSMTYNQSLNLTYVLPKAVRDLHPERRKWQLEALTKVVAVDFRLAEPFLEGLARGLDLLAQQQLDCFVTQGIDKYAHSKTLGIKFFALASQSGLDTCRSMQVTVPLRQVQSQLNRYLKARTGLTVATRPLSELPRAVIPSGRQPCVCSDSRYIYLADEIRHFPDKQANRRLYKQMTRLEAGYYEFDTFAFDLEKVLERLAAGGQLAGADRPVFDQHNAEQLSDLERFFRSFPISGLAADLFMIYEHGRLRCHHRRRYPGIVRRAYPMIREEVRRLWDNQQPHPNGLLLMYAWIALGCRPAEIEAADAKLASVLRPLAEQFEKRIGPDTSVEDCAVLVWQTYAHVAAHRERIGIEGPAGAYQPLIPPFGRCLRPDLVYSAQRTYEQLAERLRQRLKENGVKLYKADIRQHLLKNEGRIALEDLEALVLKPPATEDSDPDTNRDPVDLSWLDLGDLLGCEGVGEPVPTDVNGVTYRYVEWDCRIADYLDKHVQVVERPVVGASHAFYDLTLQRHHGLVKQIRRAFELMKPEGFNVLRQWREGDDFDYRALIDYAVERKANRMPSERLYIKRVKAQRDVAVLLLVDLSRSTANRAAGTRSRVIDIEKEAIVLLCEALEVVGDTYAIAGFSGTGRLGVDYYRVKDFEDPLDEDVRGRIHAMAPQRSTRMGAAVRHATEMLAKLSAKVRLLIVLGDGFPNDIDYKKKYAIEDTSKAIYEARARGIHVKGITVNIVGDGRLDAVYGNFHHSVITDVRELPDKLLRIYGNLTRL